jgi:hypothetical protein
MYSAVAPVRRLSIRLGLRWHHAGGFLVVLCLTLAACGQGAETVRGSVTPTASSALPTFVPTFGPTCGNLSAWLALQNTSGTATPQPVTCFLAAYAVCARTTLEFTLQGTDSGVMHTFSLKPLEGGGCLLTDAAQSYSVNFGGSHGQLQQFTCTGVAPLDGGLLVKGCGAEGDITIPSNAT